MRDGTLCLEISLRVHEASVFHVYQQSVLLEEIRSNDGHAGVGNDKDPLEHAVKAKVQCERAGAKSCY